MLAVGLWLRFDSRTAGLFEGEGSPTVFFTGKMTFDLLAVHSPLSSSSTNEMEQFLLAFVDLYHFINVLEIWVVNRRENQKKAKKQFFLTLVIFKKNKIKSTLRNLFWKIAYHTESHCI